MLVFKILFYNNLWRERNKHLVSCFSSAFCYSSTLGPALCHASHLKLFHFILFVHVQTLRQCRLLLFKPNETRYLHSAQLCGSELLHEIKTRNSFTALTLTNNFQVVILNVKVSHILLF